jgi:hypothetical protein
MVRPHPAPTHIHLLQPAQDRRLDQPTVFGEVMTGGREVLAFGHWIGNPGPNRQLGARPHRQAGKRQDIEQQATDRGRP